MESEHKLLVANRGEIAVRIIKAAQALGIKTLAVFSEADEDSMAVKIADEYVCIGPAQAARSYLLADKILEVAKEYQVTAIHPGYGFLSENAEFADKVVEAGMIFVGPSGETIRKMGDKATAIATAKAAGVPVVPGSNGELASVDQAKSVAQEVGFPLLIKASAGGGGRGIRIATDMDQLVKEFSIAQSEAKAAFGSGAVYLERFISSARHIEVQVLGDGEHAVHLFERECSLQRRRQKVFEEAPSPALTQTVRESLCAVAAKLANELNYKGAGTLEFLYDDNTDEFFFIEMNTRIQVEHPVTEMITGVDLVQWMIRIALGEPLTLTQQDITMQGWAIEMRINAEDPAKGFFPSPGIVSHLSWPEGDGIRIDSHLFEGYKIPPYYDSLLAKVIVHGKDRSDAMTKGKEALDNVELEGMKTTVGLHKLLLEDAGIQAAQFNTGYLEPWLERNQSLLVQGGTHNV
jgi:acetyl-CoA carboxylase biotin carboxylase subunit